MTATSTLDQIDWATVLDDEPACENPDGCDRSATHRLIWTCRCHPKLGCWPCASYEVEQMAKIVCWRSVQCEDCGLVQYPAVVSDLIRVEDL